MFRLAWRQLLLDPTRTVMTASVLGGVVATMLVLKGFEQGQYHQLAQFVINRQGDLILSQSGVSNLIAVRSSVPQLARQEVEAVDGVAAVHPLTALPVIYRKGERQSPVYLLVIDTKGGPARLKYGDAPGASRDIVIDASLAAKFGLDVGDPFVVSDFEFMISGIAEGAAALFTPLAFVTYDGMIDLFLESELAPDISTFPLLSFLLVDVAPSATREAVAREIEARVASVDVFRPEELAVQDVRLGRSFLAPIFGLLIALADVMGVLVIALITFADVHGRRSGFGVLKALGFSVGRLVWGVWVQTALLLALAIPAGVLLALVLAALIHQAAPVYLVRLFEAAPFVQAIGASVVFAALGAVTPIGAIRRIDPVAAFQG